MTKEKIETESGKIVYKVPESFVPEIYFSAKLTVKPNKLVLAAKVYLE